MLYGGMDEWIDIQVDLVISIGPLRGENVCTQIGTRLQTRGHTCTHIHTHTQHTHT